MAAFACRAREVVLLVVFVYVEEEFKPLDDVFAHEEGEDDHEDQVGYRQP